MEIGIDKINPSDVYASSLDDQLRTSETKIAGRVNFLSSVQDKILCQDSFFLSNINLISWLNKTDCVFLKEGILVPILRKTTIVNGENMAVKNLGHLHDLFRDQNIYDGHYTVNPEIALKDSHSNIVGIHERINESTTSPYSVIFRNTTVRSDFEKVCYNLDEQGITDKIGIKKEWKDVLHKVKENNNGIITGRQKIYKEASVYPSELKIRKIADYVNYTTIHNVALGGKSTIDYSENLADVALPNYNGKKIDEKIRNITTCANLDAFASISPEKIVELRKDYSKELWKLQNKKESSSEDLIDEFDRVYGRLMTIIGKDTKMSFGKLLVQNIDYGIFGTSILLTINAGLDIPNYSLIVGSGIWFYIKHMILQDEKRKNDINRGRNAISILKESNL